MTDRVVLAGMVFLARHGVNDREKVEEQRFEVDVELAFDTRPAAAGDDLARTVDYRGGPLDYAGVEIRRGRED
jgi:7,8-dihydroneopterin aldolase/epimerase/oxygenase